MADTYNMDRIRKTSRFIVIFLTVLFWCAVAAGAFAVIRTIVTVFGGSAAPGAEMETQLILGDYRLTLSEGLDWKHSPMTVASGISILLTAIFACYEISILKKIFRPMAEGLPFTGLISRSIRKVAWVELIYGLISIAINTVMNIIIYRSVDIPSLFAPDKVSACNISIRADGGFIVWFIILMLLSHVFRYGEELQQLSDETL